MSEKILKQGSEAVLFLNDSDNLVKKRISKSYRVKEIDEELRKSRNKREVKILQKLNINCPRLINFDDYSIEMEYIDGDVFKDKFSLIYCEQVGEMIAFMHNQDIIHGDLTTSNMILKDQEIFFIDFGLSYFSKKIEDKAVDLHLIKRALESKHYDVFEDAFKLILKGYKKSSNSDEVIKRLEVVEGRGRNKQKH